MFYMCRKGTGDTWRKGDGEVDGDDQKNGGVTKRDRLTGASQIVGHLACRGAEPNFNVFLLDFIHFRNHCGMSPFYQFISKAFILHTHDSIEVNGMVREGRRCKTARPTAHIKLWRDIYLRYLLI
jgi:hypothetical protein